MQTLFLADEAETLAFGARLAQHVRVADIVALTGDLGAGKTTLARGFIQSLSDVGEVPSPTYTLVQTYDTEEFEVWHCDMYRLEQPEDAYELGLVDAFDEAVCLIEWPDKLGPLLPNKVLGVDIQFQDQGRLVTLTGWEGRWDD